MKGWNLWPGKRADPGDRRSHRPAPEPAGCRQDPRGGGGPFGFVGHFFGLDCPASSERTRQLSGWQPKQPGLIPDLDQPRYFESRTSGPAAAAHPQSLIVIRRNDPRRPNGHVPRPPIQCIMDLPFPKLPVAKPIVLGYHLSVRQMGSRAAGRPIMRRLISRGTCREGDSGSSKTRWTPTNPEESAAIISARLS